MQPRPLIGLVVAVVASSSLALAQPEVRATAAPPPPRAPGLTLGADTFQVALTLELETTADKVGEPISIAPDFAYGVTDDLTLSLVHSRFAVTGFRAAAGGGICVTDEGCPTVYRNVGLESAYNLARGELAFAAVAGIHALDLDQGFWGAKLGFRARALRGPFALLASPSVILAVTERDDAMGAPRNRDTYWLPVGVTYRVVAPLTVGVSSGLKGSFSDLGDRWEVPLGASAQYALSKRLVFGASFVFGKLAGGAPDPMTGTDFRGIQVWVVTTY